ncbi:MAG: 4-hydroxy-3-methylbut-2-enyl diphosphate reductase, partial [Alphaproteobacteria bacterium]
NRAVVDALAAKGAVFVDELDEVPDGDAPVVFSAHGVPKAVPAEAQRRKIFYLDATCPLVSKVHREAEHHHAAGRHVILVGHDGHPEVVGTTGQLPPGAVTLVDSVAAAETVAVPDPEAVAYATQTTLSVDDTADIVAVLHRRFPAITGPRREDICYATTNRQEAVKAIAGRAQAIAVIGAGNSSNSVRLVEVARRAGADAFLVPRAADMPWSRLDGVTILGVTAGASAPEWLVSELLAACRERYAVTVEEVTVRREDVHFRLPRALAD